MARVMVVDDISIMRFTIKDRLQKLGHEIVAEASNGYNAIEQYKIFKPDLVTMDITMPAEQGVKNGIEALVEIRKFDSDAKIIMVTSHGEEKLVIEAISKGAKGYILKPVSEEKLKSVFDKIKF